MSYIKVTYPVGNSFIRSTFEDNSTYIKTSVNSTFIKVAYDGGSSGLDAERLRTKVYNVTGATLAKGTVVYINGSHGNLPSVAKAIATSDATSAQTFGLVLEDITDNKSGYIILAGKIGDLNTNAIPNGSQLYLSSTIAGGYTTTKQYAPAHLVYIGVVNRSHPTQGEIEVRIANGYEADEIHDFAVRNPSNNDGIFFNSTTSLWEKKSIGTVLGYTPANAATTLTINGVTFDISSNRSWTIAAGISGSGTSGQVSYWTGASSLGGSNNFFWDAANGRLGIGTNAPATLLDIYSATNANSFLQVGSSQNVRVSINTVSANRFQLLTISRIGDGATAALSLGVGTGPTSTSSIISANNDNLLIGYNIGNTFTETARFTSQQRLLLGTTTDDTINKLQVSGSAKFTSDILVNGINIGLGAGNVASNLRFGGSALLSNTSGAGNVALGYAAMYYNLTGSNNMAIGVQALVGNSSGDNNVAVGTAALFGNSNGYNNVAIGHWAAYDSVGSLSNTVGANNIFIGYNCLGESGIESHRTWIGNAQTTSTWLGGNLLLGTRTNGTQRLQVVGNVNFGNSTGFTWDDTNKRLGIGTNAPADTLHLNSGGIRIQNIRASLDNFYTAGVVNGLKIQNTTTNGRTLLGLVPNGTSNLADFWVFQTSDTTTNYSALAWGFELNSNFWGINAISAGTGATRPIYINATNGQAVASANISFYTNGNVGIGTGSTAPSVRFGVVGNTLLRGSGADSASTALTVQNSGSTDLFVVRNDGSGFFKKAGNSSGFYLDTNGESIRGGASGNLSLGFGAGSYRGFFQFGQNHDNGNGDNWYFGYSSTALSNISTSGNNNFIGIQGNFRPTSGTASYSQLSIYPTINQTGGANGVTRGLYVAPTLTAAFDFRAIETTSGKIIFGNLPTSSAGLPTGALWNNAGVINIV